MKDPIVQIKQAFNRAQSIAADWIERFNAELEFAAQLAEWHPAQAKKWQPLIGKAAQLVHEASLAGETSRIESAAKEGEKILAPLAATAKSY